MKKKALVSSILTIALCLSLIAGSTFALFTSTSKVNVAVTAGKVNVIATASEPTVSWDTENVSGSVPMESTAQVVGNLVRLEKIAPGCIVEFDLTVSNESDISVMYRTVISKVNDEGLWSGLKLTITDGVDTYNGESVTMWKLLAPQSQQRTVHVRLELPYTAGNEYQGKACTFAYTVEAVQANANFVTPEELTAILTPDENGVINITKDYILNGDWTTLNFANQNQITVNGNGHSIASLNRPLFNFYGISDLRFNDLTVRDSHVKGNNDILGSAVLVENAQWCSLTMNNCHVIDSTVTAGDTRAAALVGVLYGGAEITNCSVTNCEITAKGSVAGILAHEQRQDDYMDHATVKNCTVKDTKLTAIDSGWRVGTMIGTVAGTKTTISDCVSTGNTLTQENETNPNHELFGRIAGGELEILVEGKKTDYVTAETLKSILMTNGAIDHDYVVTTSWTSLKKETDSQYTPIADTIEINGNNHSISGLTMPLFAPNAAKNITIKNLTIKDSAVGSGSGNNTENSGAFVSYIDNTIRKLILDNCHLLDSSVTATGLGAGGLVGYSYTHSTTEGTATYTSKVEISNCTVKNSSVTNANGSAAGIVGFLATGEQQDSYLIKNCKVENCTIVGEKPEKTGAIVGTVNNDGTLYITDCVFTGNAVGRIEGTTTTVDISGMTYSRVADGVMQDENGVYYISTAAGLNWLNDQINNQNNSFNDQTIMLSNDIDMNGANWLPMGQNFTSDANGRYTALGYANTVEFRGTFDGNGKTISNLNINGLTAAQVAQLDDTQGKTTDQDIYSVGFFGYLQGTVKNLTFKDVTVTGYHNVGTVAGFTDATAYIDNCHVENATVTATHINDDQCGDKVGGIVGFLNNTVTNGADIKDCTVKNSTVSAGRDAGQVIGCTASGVTGADTCSATNVTVSYSGGCTDDGHGANIKDAVVGRVL